MMLEANFHRAYRPHKCSICGREIGSGARYYRAPMPGSALRKTHQFHPACYRQVDQGEQTTQEGKG